MKIKILYADNTGHLEQKINEFLQQIGTGAQIHTLIINHRQISDNVIYHFASILYRPALSSIPELPILSPDL